MPNSGRYAGKTAIITGGSKGIGRACTQLFLEAGCNVVFCARGEEEGREFEEELNSKVAAPAADGSGKPRAVFVRCDISKEEDLANLVQVTVDQFGRIDCLLNNAGWHPPHKPIDEFSAKDMSDLFNLNFMSVFILTKLCLPQLRANKGNIINMSSWVGIFGQHHAVTYAATKGAMSSFSKALAIDEAKYGVRVNIVSPGNIWTPLWKAGCPDDEEGLQAAVDMGNRQQVLGRMGTAEETAKLCLFLAAEATFTTGVDHIQSGGAELGYGMKV